MASIYNCSSSDIVDALIYSSLLILIGKTIMSEQTLSIQPRRDNVSSAVQGMYTSIAVLHILFHLPILTLFWRFRKHSRLRIRQPIHLFIISLGGVISVFTQCLGNIMPNSLPYFWYSIAVVTPLILAIDTLTLYASSLFIAFNMTTRRRQFFTKRHNNKVIDTDLKYIRFAKMLLSPRIGATILAS